MARHERTYLDFDIEIAPCEDGTLQAKVVDSPAGQAECRFTMPLDDLELENFVLRVGRTRSGRRRIGSPQYRLAREIGTRLYEAMFDEEVRIAFRRSIDRADDVGAGLRIRLRLDDAPHLTQVPWEYMFSPGVGDFLVLSSLTPVVRHLDLPMSDDPLAVEPPLSVLVVVSSPSDLELLDGEREVELVRRAVDDLAARGSVVVDTVVGTTLQELRRTLRRGEYHVLHFIGHGGYDERHEDGVLAFEDDDGRSRHISGAQLGTILHDHRTLRLVVLNACEGARTSADDPFSGVAQSLLRRGVPAVVAMQFEITDEAAIAFSHELYLALVEGEPIESAVAEARLEIFSSDNDIEWGTPVLYSRARDGRLFEVAEHVTAEAPPVRSRAELPPPPPRSTPPPADDGATEEVAPTQPDPTEPTPAARTDETLPAAPVTDAPLDDTAPGPAAGPTAPVPAASDTQRLTSTDRRVGPAPIGAETAPVEAVDRPTATPPIRPSSGGSGNRGRMLVAGVAALAVLGLGAALVTGGDDEPGPRPSATATATPSESDPVIADADAVAVQLEATAPDGIVEELDARAGVVVADDVVFGDPDAELVADFRVGWNDEALWVLADVRDGVLESPFVDDPPRLFRGDGIGMEVGADPRDVDPDDPLRPGDLHVLAGVVVESGDVVDGIAAINVPNDGGVFTDAPDAAAGVVAVAWQEDDEPGGYRILLGVPWSTIGIEPAPGVVVAANLNASDVGGDALRTMVSTNAARTADGQRHPGVWHTLALGG